jgi:thiamine pyrophosphate-dependent acetolactate synthase large subunit-like protein
MKREGIEILTGYPVNHLLEFAADINIRPVIVRQERIGLHMADAISRVTSEIFECRDRRPKVDARGC